MYEIPKVWTETDRAEHLTKCGYAIEISTFGELDPHFLCGCGEAAGHEPMAVAFAEIDRDCCPAI